MRQWQRLIMIALSIEARTPAAAQPATRVAPYKTRHITLIFLILLLTVPVVTPMLRRLEAVLGRAG